jgi:hypothetical protein
MTSPAPLSAALPQPVVRFVEPGATIHVPETLVDPPRLEPWYVLNPCGAPGRLYCTTCDQYLANIYNVEVHLQPGGEHELARWCDKHRVYEAVQPELITAIERHLRGSA